jgi:hypothetical protein
MHKSLRARIGVIAAALTIVGSLAIATPANAATGTITVLNSTIVAQSDGSWPNGLNVTGTGFGAGATVTVTLTYQFDTPSSPEAQTTATADGSGAFTLTNWVPNAILALPAPGHDVVIAATDNVGNDSNTVPLDVRAVSGMYNAPPFFTTTDIVTGAARGLIGVGGFDPGENVAIVIDFDGVSSTINEIATRAGAVEPVVTVSAPSAAPGNVTFTLTGASSKYVVTFAVPVTGPTIAAAPEAGTPAPHLPIVSG